MAGNMMNHQTTIFNKKRIAIAVSSALMLTLANPTFAEDTISDKQIEKELKLARHNKDIVKNPQTVEVIEVTGSRLGIEASQMAAQVITISAEDLIASGQPNLQRALKQLPQNAFGSSSIGGLLSEVGSEGINFAGGATVNLRGIGSESTLVLVDGKRIGKSGALGRSSDISNIPMQSVERIEVLLDGASAIYGSDAVGGVINIIMKKDYDDFTVGLQYGAPGDGGFSEKEFNINGGTTWDTGGIRAGYTHMQSSEYKVGKFDGDSSFFVPSYNGEGSNIGFSTSKWGTYEPFAIAEGYTGDIASLVGSEYLTPGFSETEPETKTLLPKKEKDIFMVNMHQELSETITAYFGAQYSDGYTYSNGNTEGSIFNEPFGVRMGPNYGLNNMDSGFIKIYNFQMPEYPSYGESNNKNTRFSFSLDGEITNDWTWDVSATKSKNELRATSFNVLKRDVAGWLMQGVYNHDDDSATPGIGYNPFSNTPSENSKYMFTDDKYMTDTEEKTVDVIIRGSDLLSLPGGELSAVLGYNYKQNGLVTLSEKPIANGNSSLKGAFNLDSKGELSSKGYFLETHAPLISKNNSMAFAKQLDLTGALRHDSYDSSAGSKTTWQLGLVYSPTDELRLRFRKSTAFKAPTLSEGVVNPEYEINPFGTFAFGADEPADGTPGKRFFSNWDAWRQFEPLLSIVGGNPDLKPENSKTTSVGFEYTPEFIPGLRVQMTHYNTDYTDRISKGAFPSFLLNRPDLVEQNYLFVDQGEVTATGIRNKDGSFPAGNADDTYTYQGYVRDSRWTNLDELVVSGVDTNISYGFDTDFGDLSFYVNYSLTNENDYDNEESEVFNNDSAQTLTNRVGDVDFYNTSVPVLSKKKYNARINWLYEQWSVDVNVSNRSDISYTNSDMSLTTKFNNPTNVNLTISYDFSDSGMDFLNGTVATLMVSNLTESDLEVKDYNYTVTGSEETGDLVRTLDSIEDAPALYPSLADARGRMFTLSLRKTF